MQEPTEIRKYEPDEFREIGAILDNVRVLAKTYKQLTGCYLGITGEVAEYEAAFHLKYDLWSARNPGFDLTDPNDGNARYQVKGYTPPKGKSKGSISEINEPTPSAPWDYVLLVILDEDSYATEIYKLSATILETYFRERRIRRIDRGEGPAQQPRALKASTFRSLSEKKPIWQRTPSKKSDQ